MGNGNCGSHPPPVPTNQCDDIGNTYLLENFCAPVGTRGNKEREAWCSASGAPGEWGYQEVQTKCQFSHCQQYLSFGGGCCNGCCGIVGNGTECVRQGFEGAPMPCCFQDYVYNACGATGTPPASSACFQTGTGGSNTCPPANRDITCGSPQIDFQNPSSCRDFVASWCSGADLPARNGSWIYRWIDPLTGGEQERTYDSTTAGTADPRVGVCTYALRRNLYTPNGGSYCSGTPSSGPSPVSDCTVPNPQSTGRCGETDYSGPVQAEGWAWGQSLMKAVFARYEADGFVLGALPGTPGYNPFQDFLLRQICCIEPGLCQGAASGVCASYTTTDLSANPEGADWCGCHLAPAEYAKYVDFYQIPVQCTPLCSRTSALPLVGGGGRPLFCTQDVCLIDDVSIDLVKSRVGEVRVGQVCGSCGEAGSCSCLIENSTVDLVDTALRGNVVVQQMCGTVNCAVNSGGSISSAPCSAPPLAEGGGRKEGGFNLFLLFLFLLLVVALFYLVSPYLYGSEGREERTSRPAGGFLPAETAGRAGGISPPSSFLPLAVTGPGDFLSSSESFVSIENRRL